MIGQESTRELVEGSPCNLRRPDHAKLFGLCRRSRDDTSEDHTRAGGGAPRSSWAQLHGKSLSFRKWRADGEYTSSPTMRLCGQRFTSLGTFQTQGLARCVPWSAAAGKHIIGERAKFDGTPRGPGYARPIFWFLAPPLRSYRSNRPCKFETNSHQRRRS